jgi:hypothetical protein
MLARDHVHPGIFDHRGDEWDGQRRRFRDRVLVINLLPEILDRFADFGTTPASDALEQARNPAG